MICLQCKKEAQETGEVSGGIILRECQDGHRTGVATIEMVKRSNKLKMKTKLSENSILSFVPTNKYIAGIRVAVNE